MTTEQALSTWDNKEKIVCDKLGRHWYEVHREHAHTRPPPCISYGKVPNYYGPYAYCSLDKAVDTQVQKENIAW